MQTQPKPRKGVRVLFVLLGILVVPLASFFTVRLMNSVFQNVGRPRPAVQQKMEDMEILADFHKVVSGRVGAVRNSMRPANSGSDREEEIPVEETVPVVRKQYWIEEGTLVAPEPNQSLFGRTDDPEVMKQVMEDAAWLLDGQTTYFRPR